MQLLNIGDTNTPMHIVNVKETMEKGAEEIGNQDGDRDVILGAHL